jgi:hypothetical protein
MRLCTANPACGSREALLKSASALHVLCMLTLHVSSGGRGPSDRLMGCPHCESTVIMIIEGFRAFMCSAAFP